MGSAEAFPGKAGSCQSFETTRKNPELSCRFHSSAPPYSAHPNIGNKPALSTPFSFDIFGLYVGLLVNGFRLNCCTSWRTEETKSWRDFIWNKKFFYLSWRYDVNWGSEYLPIRRSFLHFHVILALFSSMTFYFLEIMWSEWNRFKCW